MSAQINVQNTVSRDVTIRQQKKERKINKKLKEIKGLEAKDVDSLTAPEKVKIGKKSLLLKQLEDNRKVVYSDEKKEGTFTHINKDLEDEIIGSQREQQEIKLMKKRQSCINKTNYAQFWRDKEAKREQQAKLDEEKRKQKDIKKLKVMIYNACDVLELDSVCLSIANIDEQYKKLMQIYHPKNKHKSQEITQAYNLLSTTLKTYPVD
jgi:hypothetical protein